MRTHRSAVALLLPTRARTLAAIALAAAAITAVTPTTAATAEKPPRDDGALAAIGWEIEVEPSDMAGFIEAYRTDLDGVREFHDLRWSDARMKRLGDFYRAWIERLEKIDPATLNATGRIDWVLLKSHLSASRRELGFELTERAEIDAFIPFREAIQSLELARRTMERPDPKAAAAAIATIPEQVKTLRKRIDAGRKKSSELTADDEGMLASTPVLALRASSAVNSLRGQLRVWNDAYEAYDPTFAWWVRTPYADASKSLEDYSKYLRETVAGVKGNDDDPLIGDPIGRQRLLSDLQAEFIAYTPEQLIVIAEEEFAWCEREMLKAAAELGHGDNWKAALDQVKQDAVDPGEQAALVTEQSRDAIAFLKERDLLTIPPLCEETWRITMLSAERQRFLPFAAYGGQSMLVAYPTGSMSHEDKLMSMRGNNRHFSRIVTPHELIPGHHHQAFIAQRVRPYRSLFRTPFYVEGWALYWEMRLWDLEYPRTPEERIGMLFWRMHRCARIIVSLKFHLGEMTPQEMIDFLVDRVGHEKFGATSEVRRFIGGQYSPLYQCAYMIGGLQLRSLYDATVSKGTMDDKTFNDLVLAQNAVPIELVRAAILKTEPPLDAKPAWKFRGEIVVPADAKAPEGDTATTPPTDDR